MASDALSPSPHLANASAGGRAGAGLSPRSARRTLTGSWDKAVEAFQELKRDVSVANFSFPGPVVADAVSKAGLAATQGASKTTVLAPLLEQVDEAFTNMERLIIADHTLRLQGWTSRRCAALERAGHMDSSILEAQIRECEACAADVEADAEALERARYLESEAVAGARERACAEFRSEMQELGDTHAMASTEFVAKTTSSMRARCEYMEAREWRRLDELTSAISWEQARRHTSARNASLQQLFDSGALQPLLEAEREGWSRSQHTDFERLQSDIDAECREVFRGLRQRLEESHCMKQLVGDDSHLMEELEERERARFAALQAEVAYPYESEAQAALEQCEEDYRVMDSELQEVLYRTSQHRQQSMAAMRQLKLALCGWRLDYQREYHEQLAALARKPPEEMLRTKRPAADPAEVSKLETLRRSAKRLWNSGLSSIDIHGFLARTADLSARHGCADSIVRLYEEELRRLNALPLLEHARQPELLDCWLRTLARAKTTDDDGLHPR